MRSRVLHVILKPFFLFILSLLLSGVYISLIWLGDSPNIYYPVNHEGGEMSTVLDSFEVAWSMPLDCINSQPIGTLVWKDSPSFHTQHVLYKPSFIRARVRMRVHGTETVMAVTFGK